MYKAFWVPIGLLLTAGCGLGDDVLLAELDDKEQTKLCEELTDFDPVVLTCDELETTYNPTPVDECMDEYAALPSGCTATVGDARACIEAIQNADCETDLFAGPCGALADASCIPEEPVDD